MTEFSGLAAVHAAASAVARADHDAAINAAKAERDTAVAAARAEGIEAGRKEGATTERARVKSILGAEDAKGREAFAAVYAFETDMSAEAATAALKDKPKAEAPRTSRLDGRVPQPNVQASEPGNSKAASESWNSIVSDLNKQQGRRSVA